MSEFVTKKGKYSNSDPRQNQLTDALLKFIAGNLLPLSVVESEEFKNLMEIAESRYQMPSRKHLSTKLLYEKSTEVRNNIKHQLKMADSVSLTIDIWFSRQMRGYIGMTAHFILDWNLRSILLCCKRFKGKHTSENIRNAYEEALACFDIANKTTAVVSDNATNMVKAFSIPGFELNEICSENDNSDSDDECSETDDTTTESSIDVCLPKHVRCFAHTLQLVVKDGLKECNNHLKQVVLKASQIVNFVRKSVNASEILEEYNRLQAANVTRWNSQLYMLRSILNVPEHQLNKIECKIKLSPYERKLLKELCIILEPFEKATLLVQGEQSITASLAIPVICGLRHQLNLISVDYNSKMLTTLKKSINSRLSLYDNEDCFVIASIVDPRFKLRWCETEKVTEYIELLKAKAAKFPPSASISSETNDETVSPPSKKMRSDDLFSFMPSTPSRKRHVSGRTGQIEVDEYIDEPCCEMSENPLMFWQGNSLRFPSLSKLATEYLSIPATSAPVERIFSVAEKTFRPDRCRLGDETFEHLMNIKCNGKQIL